MHLLRLLPILLQHRPFKRSLPLGWLPREMTELFRIAMVGVFAPFFVGFWGQRLLQVIGDGSDCANAIVIFPRVTFTIRIFRECKLNCVIL
jgi:hypothetical protein